MEDRRPGFPLRRMIAVAVMMAGLIAPLLVGALRVAGAFPLGAFILAGLASGLLHVLVALWKGRLWAWRTAFALFVVGTVVGALAVAATAVEMDREGLAVGGAILGYFGIGLGALCSVRGGWLRRLEWTLSVDPLANADKPALAAALRRQPPRKRGASP